MIRLRAPTWRVKPPERRIAPASTAGGYSAQHYQTDLHRQWARAVKLRDSFTCQKCGAHGEGVRLIADHINELRDGGAPTDIANGITMCLACHNKKTGNQKAARGKAQFFR